MNAYLKEIADLCGVNSALTTHKARRTFASTITLANDVPIHIVKEMLGHHSIQQTEEYAVTEQQAIGLEMQRLRRRLDTPIKYLMPITFIQYMPNMLSLSKDALFLLK